MLSAARRLARTGLCFALFTSLILAGAPARAEGTPDEYSVKAACLGRFVQFVTWPGGAGGTAFVVGLVGEDPFPGGLEKCLQGLLGGRKLTVRRTRRTEDLRSCQLVFVGKFEQSREAEIIAGLQGAPVLTVGDREGFAREGGMIDFFVQNGHVAFEVNPSAAKSSGLAMSSKLVGLGKLIKP